MVTWAGWRAGGGAFTKGAILKLGLSLTGEWVTTNLFWAKAQRGEKTMTQARRKITAGLEENVLDDTWKRMAPGQVT